MGLFWRQFAALFWKNWIVLSKHPFFLLKPNNYGIGSPIAVYSLQQQFRDVGTLLWADATDGNSQPSPTDIMARVTSGFSASQLSAVKKASSGAELPFECPQNFHGFSECYAAVVFYDIPAEVTSPVNYTILADSGLFHIDIVRHTSDFETRAIIELRTGVTVPTPLEWPFTNETNEEQDKRTRLSFIRGIRELLVIAFRRRAREPSNATYEGHGSARFGARHVLAPEQQPCVSPRLDHCALVWRSQIWVLTNVLLILVVHILLGLTLASWSFFVAAPFGKSPQLAAVFSTLLSILFAILALILKVETGGAFLFTIIFPPGFYVFANRAISGYENHSLPTDALKGDPDRHIQLLTIIIAGVRAVEFAVVEVLGSSQTSSPEYPPDIAVSIQGLGKTFNTSMFNRKGGNVTAVPISPSTSLAWAYSSSSDRTVLEITTLSVVGGLTGRSQGNVVFEGGVRKPPRGTLGIVPQKNWSSNSVADEDLEQLLRDCDLQLNPLQCEHALGRPEAKAAARNRACGGSKIVLVDECTSGVDPLSRRALWRTLISVRLERTADLLADNIAILAAPGKLVASGSPVALKRDLGEGYTVQVSLSLSDSLEKTGPPTELLQRIRTLAPYTHMSLASLHQPLYHLKSKDTVVVDQEGGCGRNPDNPEGTIEPEENSISSSASSSIDEPKPVALNLATGRATSPLQQALTIFYKRSIIFRRSWLTPLLAVVIAIAGSTIPLVFISGRSESCVKTLDVPGTDIFLFPPTSPLLAFYLGLPSRVLDSPPGIIDSLGNLTVLSIATLANLTSSTNSTDLGNTTALQPFAVLDLPDNATFVSTIQQNFQNITTGGVSFDATSGNTLVAWEATAPGLMGPTMLNLASNILLNHALNTSGRAGAVPSLLMPSYETFPPVDVSAAGTLVALKWIAYFCAVMSMFPAFFALYVSKERRTSVQAMQFSNGLHDPIGLWLGHLAFDTMFTVLMSTGVMIIFAAVSNQFHGLGFFWLVMVLYGIAGTLFAYCASLLVTSPLAAFAAVAGYQIAMFLLYIAGYLLVLTYAKTSDANRLITIIHFTLSVLSPVASVTRAGLVSINMFSLLCNGSSTTLTTSSMSSIMRYGGPIAYLVVYSFVLLAFLVWFDSGSILPQRFRKRAKVSAQEADLLVKEDVASETRSAPQSDDPLRVLNVTKTFGSNTVVDDVSFGASRDTIFCLLGPNGAGKTTTFNMIRGDVLPEYGDVLIQGTSVVNHPRTARASLGVCPQFSAIDAQLTVREHLAIYGRLKGLRSEELTTSIESLMVATGLHMYADRLASKLSGGNQRKLSLAIALMGNPAVVLIDEFSTGIDAKKKREMWRTLRAVAVGKVFVITTHAMEEASALATKVGILAVRLLAIGTTESLSARYATYEVHFTCRTREEVTRAQTLMSAIPGARMADDVATRFEVPIEKDNGLTLAKLFHLLSAQGDFSEYTVEKATLESVFLKVIRENNVQEEGHETPRRRRWWLPSGDDFTAQ
ncbi:hypothetical protein K438DRAFT_1757492 [Mycena galopus ATCC 62051]|nr:hypothetical protein K438DRAFT_1757492 [Mycena galopus ATCC 62051]